ncbi:hypothetical protein JCM10213_006714 [Rhodosporidiobolus nylandii]
MAKKQSSASSATRKKHAAKAAKRAGGDDGDVAEAAQAAGTKAGQPPQRGQKKQGGKKEKRDRFAPKIKTYTPPPPPPKGAPDPVDVYILGQGKGAVVDAELVVVLRRLHKKDEATVQRGVDGLEQWVKETVRMSEEQEGEDWERELREEGVVEAMAVWAHHFARLSLHPSRRLRLSVHALHSLLLGASPSRSAQPALFAQTRSALLAPLWVEQPQYVGAWAVSAWDTDRAVRREAKRSWDSVLLQPLAPAVEGEAQENAERDGIELNEQGESIAGFALSLVLPSVSSGPSSTSGTETPNSEPEDPSFLRTSALLTLAHLLSSLPAPLPLPDPIVEALVGEELWSLVERAEGDARRTGVSDQPQMVRRAAYEMLEALVEREEEILLLPAGEEQGEEDEDAADERERRLRTVAQKVLVNCWAEEEGWAGIVAFLRRYPQAWALADSSLSTPAPSPSEEEAPPAPSFTPSPTLSLLLAHLRTGCSMHPSLYPTILLLLSTLPPSILPASHEALDNLFTAFWSAKDSRALAIGGRPAVASWAAALLECLVFEAFKLDDLSLRAEIAREWIARKVWLAYLGVAEDAGKVAGTNRVAVEVEKALVRLAAKDVAAFTAVWKDVQRESLSVFGSMEQAAASLPTLGVALHSLSASKDVQVRAKVAELANEAVRAAVVRAQQHGQDAGRESLLSFLGETRALDGVANDAETLAQLHQLALSALPPLIASSPAALRLLVAHLSSAAPDARDRLWAVLFTPHPPSPSTLLALLDALPRELADSLPTAGLDDHLLALSASVLASPPQYTQPELSLLLRLLTSPAPLASPTLPAQLLSAGSTALAAPAADALRSRWSAPPELDALVAPTALLAHAAKNPSLAQQIVELDGAPPSLFDVAYLFPSIRLEEKGIYVPGEAVAAAEEAFRAVSALERASVSQQVQQRTRERITDADCRASPIELVDAAASLDGAELGDVLPARETVERLFADLHLPTPQPPLAIVDVLVPGSSDTPSSPAEQSDSASLTPLSRALLALLELSARDHSLLRRSAWALPYLLVLAQTASDELASPSPRSAASAGGLFGPQPPEEILRRVQAAAEGASSYLLSSLANGLSEGWHTSAVAHLRSAAPQPVEVEKDAVLATLAFLFGLARSGKNGKKEAAARAVRTVLGRVLRYSGDGGEDEGRVEAERWLALAGGMQTSPDLASSILLAVKPILLETPRFTRYQSELASTLSGVRPSQLDVKALPLLQQLLATAPALDEPVIFLPQQRAMFLLRAVQQWVGSDEGLPEEAQPGIMELLGHLAPIVQDLSGSHWETMFDLIESNLESADWAEASTLPATFYSCKLLALIKELSTANAELRETARKRVETCVELVLGLFVSRPASLAADRPRALVVETMAQLVKDLPPRLLNMDKSFAQLLRLLHDPSLAVQLSSYDLLRRIIAQHVSDLVVETELDAEEQVVVEFPAGLLKLLEKPLQAGDEAEKATSYLFAWMTAFSFFENSSPRLRSTYIEQLRNLNLVPASLLPSLFSLLSVTDRTRPFDLAPWSIDDFHFEHFDASSPLTLPIFAAHVYYRSLQAVPSIIRSYWTSLQNLALSRTVQSFTSRHFSPLLIADELAVLRDPTAPIGKQLRDNDDFSVKVAANGSEVKVVFVVDEESMELGIKLPNEYPLAAVEVKDVRKVGVTDKQWRAWLLGMQQAAQSTNVVDSVVLFKRNAEAHFEGQEACAICYSTVSTIDRSLPTKSCKTCNNKFHAGCLYKWFQTSHGSTCPLCRQIM